MKNRNHPNYNIFAIGQNTEKSLGDLRKLPSIKKKKNVGVVNLYSVKPYFFKKKV